jgi:hypothetical protein
VKHAAIDGGTAKGIAQALEQRTQGCTMSKNAQPGSGDRDFADLESFEAIRSQGGLQAGNVLKGAHVAPGEARAIEIHDESEDQPAIIVRREGDRVVGIEFICKCGCSTTVTLERVDE